MLDQKQIDSITQAAADASLGFNTQDLARRYHRDVMALLTERRQLLEEMDKLKNETKHGNSSASTTTITAGHVGTYGSNVASMGGSVGGGERPTGQAGDPTA